uniref:Conotoxin H superfamily protein n=1 Tax=Conus buxeus loroisii TaxID=410709 RepID=A0AA49X9U7_CONBL|nr:conotoxin precursor H superfamily protein [Conus buxeus loroisii]
MRTSGRLLLLCLAVGLLLESQAHPIADAGDATRNVGSEGTSVELSKMIERGQDPSAEKGRRKAFAYVYHYYVPFPTSAGIPDYLVPTHDY